MKIGKRQQEVLSLLAENYTTQESIARRLKISQQAVSKIMRKLVLHGLINPVKRGVVKGGGCKKPFIKLHPVRLHNLHFHVKVLSLSDRFSRCSQRVFRFGDCTVALNLDSLEVYLTKSFYGSDVDLVTQEALDFFFVVLNRLESRFNVVLFKDGSTNVSLVRRHYSEVFNELAREYEDSGDKLRIVSKDGKLWLVIDFSKPEGVNLQEVEAVHPVSSLDDSRKVVAWFNGVRKTGLTPEFILDGFDRLIADRSFYAKNLRDHVKAINDLREGINELVVVVKSFKKM